MPPFPVDEDMIRLASAVLVYKGVLTGAAIMVVCALVAAACWVGRA